MWLLLAGLFAMVCFQVIPTRITITQFKDKIVESIQLNPRADERQLRNLILKHAKDLDLPVGRENLDIDKNLKRARVKAEFVVPVDLIVYTYEWNVKINIDRDIFLM
ncbi:MAG: hypothetical protein AAF772_08055 [Acidobacteriota bacterium]